MLISRSDQDFDRTMDLMLCDLITVNEARRRVGSEPLADGDHYWSEDPLNLSFKKLDEAMRAQHVGINREGES